MGNASVTVAMILSGTAVLACARSAPDTGQRDAPIKVSPAEVPPRVGAPPATAGEVVGEVPPGIIEKLRADLASRIGAEPAARARVVLAKSVEWPDGSLGCPVPGEMYTQAIVPGYQVDFATRERTWSYRGSNRGFFKLCEPAPRRRPAAG